jgi:outer membrane protein TolC
VSAAAVLNRVTVSPEAAGQLERTVNRSLEALPVPVEPLAAGAAGPPLSLADAIAFALQNSPRLRTAAASVARANGQEVVAFAPFLPEVDLYTRTGISSPALSPGAPGPVGAILPVGLDDPHSYTQAELGVQWTIWDFGRRSGRYGQAVSRQRIAELQLARTRQTVAFDVATAYVAVMLAQATRVEQEQTVRRAEAVLHDVRARRAAGTADRDDVLRAEVQLADVRESLVLAREMEFDAAAKLNHTMGRNSALPLTVINWQTQPRFDGSLVECLQTAAAERREVRIAQEAVAAGQFGVRAAEAEFYPRIYILAAVGNVSGEGVRTGWHEGAGLHLNQKFFAGGRRQGEQQMAEADFQAAVGDAQAVFDGISLEVNLAFRRLTATRERIGLAEPAVAQARENLRLVEVKYRNGDATPTDVVDAETTLTRAVQRYNFAVYDHLTALARLEYATGVAPGSLLEKSQAAAADEGPTLPPPRELPPGARE